MPVQNACANTVRTRNVSRRSAHHAKGLLSDVDPQNKEVVMFHARDGLFFERVWKEEDRYNINVVIADEGKRILIVKDGQEVVSGMECRQITLTDSEFASVMASMCHRRESSETYQEALAFLRKSA